MKEYKGKIAAVLITALMIGIFGHSIYIKEKKVYASSENAYVAGEAVENLSIDLTGFNTVTTGAAITLDLTDRLPRGFDYKYFSDVKITYDLTCKDDSTMEEELRKEEERIGKSSLGILDWEICSVWISWDKGNLSIINANSKDFKQTTSYLHENEGYYEPEDIALNLNFSIQSYSGKWPICLEKAKITSIEFIAYEGAVYGEPVKTPSPTVNPNAFTPATPEPTVMPETDYSVKTGKVENFSYDLSKMQTTFFKSRIWIDFRGQLGVNWYAPENYESIKIKYKVNRRDDSLKPNTCTMNEWRLHTIEFALVEDELMLDGFSEEAGRRKYVNEPLIDPEGVEVTLPWTIDGQPTVGINIEPMTIKYKYPLELDSIEITGIELIAKEDAVYPEPKVTPPPTAPPQTTPPPGSSAGLSDATPAPTQTQTPEKEPEEPIEKIKNFKAKVKNEKEIKLSWTPSKTAEGYEIYRSTKKNSGYKKISTLSWEKGTYTDKKCKRATTYYYKIRQYRQQENARLYSDYVTSGKVLLKRKAPVFTLKRKKTAQGISYISIHLKSWADPYVEIQVKSGNKKYVTIPLTQKNIVKNKKTYNFKYSAKKGTLKFKIRTYRKNKKEKEYSYATIKGI